MCACIPCRIGQGSRWISPCGRTWIFIFLGPKGLKIKFGPARDRTSTISSKARLMRSNPPDSLSMIPAWSGLSATSFIPPTGTLASKSQSLAWMRKPEMPNPYAPPPSSSDTKNCFCCGAPFGVDWDSCECSLVEASEGKICEAHPDGPPAESD